MEVSPPREDRGHSPRQHPTTVHNSVNHSASGPSEEKSEGAQFSPPDAQAGGRSSRWLDPSDQPADPADDESLVRPHREGVSPRDRQVMSPRVVGLDGRDDLTEANIDELRGLVTESEFRLIRELRRTIRNFEGTQQQGMSLSDLGQ